MLSPGGPLLCAACGRVKPLKTGLALLSLGLGGTRHLSLELGPPHDNVIIIMTFFSNLNFGGPRQVLGALCEGGI